MPPGLGIVAQMRLRALMERSPWVRAACIMLLLVFILICGIHLAGILHDSRGLGLGLIDWLAAILLFAVLGLALAALNQRRSLGSSPTRPVHRETFRTAAVDASSFRMVVPLRC